MARSVSIENQTYDIDKLSDTSRKFYGQLIEIDKTINEKKNLSALLVKAKQAYISDLKNEILSQKAGFDFSD